MVGRGGQTEGGFVAVVVVAVELRPLAAVVVVAVPSGAVGVRAL